MSICLCMIVKNESSVIEKTLQNLVEKIPIQYWVISDTGSTDNTPSIITEFFKNKIPGELVHHEWKDFGYNRTKVLDSAFKKTDYVMMFDADDYIEGVITIPTLTKDKYMATFGTDVFKYNRPLFFTNKKKWYYTGVLHEYLDSPEPRTVEIIHGEYHVVSGRTGARNKNPNKYFDDAVVLAAAYEVERNEPLKRRYAFYCAQSFRDCNHKDKAIQWYLTCLSTPGYAQESYCASYELGNLYYSTNASNAALHWCNSSIYDPERIEGIVRAVSMFYSQGNHIVVNALYHKWRGYSKVLANKLFLHSELYDYELEYYNSISAYYVHDHSSGYTCCKEVILRCTNKHRVDQSIQNLRFFKPFLDKDKQFYNKVSKMGINI